MTDPDDSRLPSKPGWYRVTGHLWEWLAPPETRSRDLPDDPFTLVLIEASDHEEIPLW